MKYLPHIYLCPKCGVESKHHVWDNEIETTEFSCPKCAEKLSAQNRVENKKIEVPGIKTPTKNRF